MSSIFFRPQRGCPAEDFAPSPGEANHLRLLQGPGVRVGSMLYPGCPVLPYYDALVCKSTVWAKDLPVVIRCIRRALRELQVEDIAVTTPSHWRVPANAGFKRGDYDTHFPWNG